MSDTCISHIENYWKTLTMTANDSFHNGDYDKALTGYQDALFRAELLNNYQEDCTRLTIPFMQVYIISCNNLANTYSELGQCEMEEKMRTRVVYYLLHLSRHGHFDLNELQQEFRRASISLLDFVGKKGGRKGQEELLQNLKDQLAENHLIHISE
ncbi:MAG: hypothetical protein JO154_13735 [Chitinophaga sp.]|uniref:hypothetical protein n=1 Tax=Chitinophaga sp. TaxID=1869181 RepID=UPI0025C4AAA8|nr:hypothetical protein [Chitinophaga sp.]MBV8253664.1 hypothetical protein [Chitinophaga sp.]